MYALAIVFCGVRLLPSRVETRLWAVPALADEVIADGPTLNPGHPVHTLGHRPPCEAPSPRRHLLSELADGYGPLSHVSG